MIFILNTSIQTASTQKSDHYELCNRNCGGGHWYWTWVFMLKDVNSILQWIVGAFYGGYIASNMLKWYWWRFNAQRFFWGMMAGIVAALVFPFIFSGLPLYNWPLLFLISIIGCIAGTYSAPANRY